jgi:hypothetical protein
MFYKTGKHARVKSSSVPHAVDNPTVIRTLHPQLSREQAPRNLVQGESTANKLQLLTLLYTYHKMNVQW